MLNAKFGSIKQNVSKLRSALGLGGLVFVFVAVFFVNEKTVSELEQSSQVRDREIASAHPAGTFSRDTTWQKNLASRIAEMPEVPAGKSARPPNSIERFLFGELKGYYLMQLTGDKVREMMLKQKEAEDVPHYLGEELSLLQKNKELWWIDFANLQVKERNSSKSVVKLLDSAQRTVGEALFSWDSAGRLLSLKIEKQ